MPTDPPPIEPGYHHHPLSLFEPNETNPRVISDEDFERLRADVRDENFQQARPIIVDLHERDVVGGNQRYRAKVANGDTHGWFWIEDFSGPGGQDRREEWLFKDNGDYGQWVPDAVAAILQARTERGAAVDILGLREARVEELMNVRAHQRRLRDPYAEPPPPPATPVTKIGDVIKLGQHTLMCGDSRDAGQITALMTSHGEHQAQLLYTDPPYGVSYVGGLKPREPIGGDEKGTNIYADFLAAAAEADVLDDLAPMYLYHADRELPAVIAALAEHGWEIKAGLLWLKNRANYITPAHYKALHESILYCSRGDAVRWYGPNNETTVWDQPHSLKNTFHATQKPVENAERAMRNSTREGDTVLDLFGGSGATLIAGETQNRRVAMMELDPGLADVIVARWEAVTDEKARR